MPRSNDSSSTPSPSLSGRRRRGRAAEDLVSIYLKNHGFKILDRNVEYRGIGELDIVAMEGDVICFVEVRSRRDASLGEPSETVGAAKQRKLRKLAQHYLDLAQLENAARFDVASVVWKPSPKIHYIEDAFF